MISNVPGPPVPVYAAGAQLLAHYPVSVVTDGLGLNMTVISYLGGLHFGLVAARERVPDVDRINDWLEEELATLVELARKEQQRRSEAEAAARTGGARKSGARKRPPRPARATVTARR